MSNFRDKDVGIEVPRT